MKKGKYIWETENKTANLYARIEPDSLEFQLAIVGIHAALLMDVLLYIYIQSLL